MTRMHGQRHASRPARWNLPAFFPLLAIPGFALAIFTPAQPAFAANQITGGCSASSTGINLPAYDVIAKTQRIGTATLAVRCTGTGTATAEAALTGGSGTCSARSMSSGSSQLSYNIYTDATYGTIWCQPTRIPLSFTFNSQTIPQTLIQNITMYVRVPASQTIPVGAYTDTVGSLVFWTGGNSGADNFTVAENAPASCSASVTSLAFGTFTGAVKTGTASVSVNCSSGSAYTIALSGGSYLSGTQRRMKSAAGQFIAYSLYKDAALANVWGDGTTLGTTASGGGNTGAQSYTVYGRAPAAALPPPGSYADSVVVTVSY
jgi:spore coat protein U-like protein